VVRKRAGAPKRPANDGVLKGVGKKPSAPAKRSPGVLKVDDPPRRAGRAADLSRRDISDHLDNAFDENLSKSARKGGVRELAKMPDERMNKMSVEDLKDLADAFDAHGYGKQAKRVDGLIKGKAVKRDSKKGLTTDDNVADHLKKSLERPTPVFSKRERAGARKRAQQAKSVRRDREEGRRPAAQPGKVRNFKSMSDKEFAREARDLWSSTRDRKVKKAILDEQERRGLPHPSMINPDKVQSTRQQPGRTTPLGYHKDRR
jgi:hypothetical protein